MIIPPSQLITILFILPPDSNDENELLYTYFYSKSPMPHGEILQQCKYLLKAPVVIQGTSVIFLVIKSDAGPHLLLLSSVSN